MLAKLSYFGDMGGCKLEATAGKRILIIDEEQTE
jgi:hypothetical protein